jgi:hypothetical protein
MTEAPHVARLAKSRHLTSDTVSSRFQVSLQILDKAFPNLNIYLFDLLRGLTKHRRINDWIGWHTGKLLSPILPPTPPPVSLLIFGNQVALNRKQHPRLTLD